MSCRNLGWTNGKEGGGEEMNASNSAKNKKKKQEQQKRGGKSSHHQQQEQQQVTLYALQRYEYDEGLGDRITDVKIGTDL